MMLRVAGGEAKARPDHVAVFRQFISKLERLDRETRRRAKSTPLRKSAPRKR